MKKRVMNALSIAILLIGISACGKTTTGKISNDWKITSMEDESVQTDGSGDKNITRNVISGMSLNTTKIHDSPDGSSFTEVETGIVNTNDFIIKKDGTWSTLSDILYDKGDGETWKYRREESGTWSFIKKTEGVDYKKNERVLFNTLKTSFQSVKTQFGTVFSDNSSTTSYLTGERSRIYSVTSSDKNKLEMKIEHESTSSGSSGLTYKYQQKLVLQKRPLN